MNEILLISTLASLVLVPIIICSKYFIRHIKKCNCCGCISIETNENNNQEEKNK